MSLWEPHGVNPPRSDEELSGWETAHLITSGTADSNEVDLPLSEPEEQREKRLRRERIARRRPPGFAPWPEDRRE